MFCAYYGILIQNWKHWALARGKQGTKVNEDLVMNWKIKNLDDKSFLLQWPWTYTPFGKSWRLKQEPKK